MIEKPKVLKCTLKVLENRSTFEMYLSTSTSTEDFPGMYLSTFQVLYKLYLSTDVLKYKVLMPGSGCHDVDSRMERVLGPLMLEASLLCLSGSMVAVRRCRTNVVLRIRTIPDGTTKK